MPLAWNCYEYYTSIALIAYAILLAHAAGSRAFPAAAAVLFVSSALSTLGNHFLEEPALLARARWGQRQLEIVAANRPRSRSVSNSPIVLWIEDERRFDALGLYGLAYVLDRSIEDFARRPRRNAVRPPAGPMLVVPSEGRRFLGRRP